MTAGAAASIIGGVTEPEDRPPFRTAGGLRPCGFFAFRTCALPMNVLSAWADQVQAPHPGPDDQDRALAHDRELLRARLDVIARRPDVVAALSVASPDLVDAVRIRRDHPRVEAALVRYVVRMASRPTPFGLFAACGSGLIGEQTRIELPDPAAWGRFTQLDANYLDALVRERATALAERLTLTPNDSLHRMGGRWRYVESRLDGLERSHHLVEVAGSGHLQRAIDAAHPGAKRRAVVDAVAAGGVDPARAAGYVDRLVDAQVLVPSLAVTITGPPPLDSLIADLEALGDEATATVLRAVRDDLAALDAERSPALPERHEAIATRLRALPVPIDRARFLHVDAIIPACEATLARTTVDEITRGVEVLRRLTPRRPASDLDNFRDAFAERYGEQEVPLLDALDEELGVGFGSDHERRDPAPLLDGLQLPAGSVPESPFGARERRLLDLLHAAWSAGAAELALTSDDVAELGNDEARPLPAAVAATAVLARTSAGVRVVLTGANGPSGARLLGRFCHADPQLEGHVRAHLRAEEALDPDAVHAEIVHLPSGRMVNVLARPALRDHEITWLGRSGIKNELVLPAADLLISIRDGAFVLRSRRLQRRVVPHLTSAHNANRHSPGVYRFLAAVESDGALDAVAWTWFPFDRAPFTPRVRFGSLIVSRARWWVSGKELGELDRSDPVARWRAVQAFRERRRLPRWICLVDGDNVLPIDLDNVLGVDTFVRTARHRGDVLLEELFPGPDELVADAPDGRHAMEVVIPLVRTTPAAPVPRAAADTSEAPFLRRVFPPGTEWSFLKLYAGSATADRLLQAEIAPLARHLLDSGAADSWFFLRYADPGFHLRVRFHGDTDAIRPALDALVARVVDGGLVHDAVLGTYRREIERYGGPEGMVVSERIFHADSDAVVGLLDVLGPGAPGLRARWQIGVLGAETLLTDLGVDEETRGTLAHRMRDAFGREFRADARLRKGIAGRVRAELPALDELLGAAPDGDHPLAAGIRILGERSSAIAPLAVELDALRAAGRLGLPIAELAVSLVHMWLNRLCRSESRFHEYVTYALLARLHEVRAAHARRPP